MASWVHWPTKIARIIQRFGANPAVYAKFGLPGHGESIWSPDRATLYLRCTMALSVTSGLMPSLIPW